MKERYYYSIGSGSSGNCGLYVCGDTAVLIDLGVSVRRVTAALRRRGLEFADLAGILITHEHNDHIKGLATYVKKHHVPLYASRGAAEMIARREPGALPLLRPFWGGESFSVGGLQVESFLTPHDSPESVGYVFRSGEDSFGYATDLGFVPSPVRQKLLGCSAVVLESNHDLTMLETGPYPYILKQRVAGPRGHLSNVDCAACAVELVKNGTKTLILAHLSEENNRPALAKRETEEAVAGVGSCRVFVAPKNEMDGPVWLSEEGQCSLFA
ncbi:MAG: MBL fold metallo-hydrolase [Clostridiaceae bacterium]|nr:MBL fold metallo-hydrolase [Clostridiaceae bacterium]MCI9483530.1 MBL fold metallo-hydrolase [Clostridiaceae bacterium]NBH80064.1 MBL fold metallo-hydrolase [Clostridiaceae bacterium]NBI81126.1 MBL fold metallo-hydrolase [Clostridiaceae bacterium]RKJ82011.1 MBL fold metallo-hydrolase [Butyricicoccus sp. 1XD8-22]